MQQTQRRNAVGMQPSVIPAEEHKRMLVFGAPAVGKTQLVSRFLGRQPSDIYLPTAEDFHRMMYSIRGRTYELEILDTAGRVICPLMQKITILTGDMFVVVYSITDRNSFERAKEIVDFVESVLGDPLRTHKGIERNFKNLMLHPKLSNAVENIKKQKITIPIVLAGNKIDLDGKRKIETAEAEQWLLHRQTNVNNDLTRTTHVEFSAKEDINVKEFFESFFSLSSLPREMSPYLHRKVSEDAYAMTTLCDNAEANRKIQNRVSLKKKLSIKSLLKAKNYSDSDHSSSDETSDDESVGRSKSCESLNAVATARCNDRRPSVDTEVILAMSKSRSYTVSRNGAKNGKIKIIGDHFKSLKKQVKSFKL